MKPRRLHIFVILCIILSQSSCEDVEKDARYISHEDLMSYGSDRFTDDGVTSFGKILFDVARDQLFVGAKDNLYRLTLRGLNQLEKANWPAPAEKTSLCQDKGQSEDNCHNYVKVLLTEGRRLFTCGTNAFSPQCSWRELENVTSVIEWVNGVAKCPYNPNANITALMTMTGQYYVGSPTDFSGSDPAIYRAMGSHSGASHTLRTHQYDSKWLNEPQFVGSFEDDKFVFFVFREAAVEYINCGKRIYSRIARVCKNDAGGQLMLRDNWTTFVKARLNCSVPGEYPFYYDEIQGMEYLPDQRLLYATFTTPMNGIAGSAICVFNMSSIERAFQGPFKHQENPGSAWESRHLHHQLHTHCQSGQSKSQQLADSSRYQLMDNAIQPASESPLHTVNLERYTHLTAAIVTTKHSEMHMLFVATDSGLVKKLSILPDGGKTCVIEIWKPESNNLLSPIKTIQYLKDSNSVYIGTEMAVIRIPAASCGRYKSRTSCLGAQDPLCGWNEMHEVCASTPSGSFVYWTQQQPACPDPKSPLDGGWSTWSPWEVCIQNNNFLMDETPQDNHDKCLCQTRQCNNPAPKNGGKSCSGASISVTNCTVHGGWTAWSGWSACSATCGVAVKWRRRTCAAPAPLHGGRLCVGPDRSEIYCTQNPPCPEPVAPIVEGKWSDWSPWTRCSAPCGGGVRWRHRRCDNPPPGEGAPPCPGCSIEAETCNNEACDTQRLSAWTPWVAVLSNNTDDGYVEKRFKFTCKAQGLVTTQPVKMLSSKEEERFCTSDGACGANSSSSGWSDWSSWNDCSVSCGGGYRTSTRKCLTSNCKGIALRQSACNTHSCNDGWGCWSDWSECSGSCGESQSRRSRICFLPNGCEGSHEDYKPCDKPPCIDSTGWGEWSEWSECDDYNQRRTRKCLINDLSDSDSCQGPTEQNRDCKDDIGNDLNASGAYGPEPVLAMANGSIQKAYVTNILIVLSTVSTILAILLIVYVYKLRHRNMRGNRIPSSPHYMSQPNSYVSIPLKEVPKKRKPSFSGAPGTGTLTKANNINSDKNHIMMGTPKLYPKSMAADYEATMKRNSNTTHGNGNCRNNLDLEQEKFY